MAVAAWIALIIGLLLAGVTAYWLLIITEGTYLGQPIVTWMYDLVAKRYDSIKGFDAQIEAAYLGRPLASEPVLNHARLVLDIGTGTGRLPLTLFDQPRFQGRIIGIDASKAMLHIAAKKLTDYGERCWLVHETVMHLPFASASFDAVTMLEMLEFTPSPTAALQEAVRVLRSGGLFLTTRRTGLDAKLMPQKTSSEEAFRQMLSGLSLEDIRIQRWQVDYDLVWARKSGASQPFYSNLFEILICRQCGEPAYDLKNSHLICRVCGFSLRFRDGVIEMMS